MMPFGFVKNAKAQTPACLLQEVQRIRVNKDGKQIFSKNPIVPQSSKKDPAACSKLAEPTPKSTELTLPVLAALADS